ncbi:hypothetical protein BXZ70DRAFT_636665 [Cristinia sonorae]|uniref:F-box domain-containing protein n=1 Tax=Cristinia sonorae TaxID=1940300 RepID=A0A8K0UEC6_9AGAR|nr:hypothetical protein BXZ70DRAFT_636665 [Cristinia sonorae]
MAEAEGFSSAIPPVHPDTLVHTRSPITNLPAEVLAQIFLCRVKTRKDRPTDANPSSSPAPWWTLSAVCQYWRNVALHTARLWNEINVASASVELTELFLSRSAQAALVIHGSALSSESNLEPLRLVLKELGRICVLSVGLTPAVLELFQATPFTAPLLSVLDIFHHSDPNDILAFLEGLQAPVLRDLMLSASYYAQERVDWLKFPFPSSLTQLIVDGESFFHTHPSLIADSIGHLRHLTFLSLDDILQDPDPEDHHPQLANRTANFSIELPELEEVELIEASVAAAASFLRYLKVPDRTHIALTPHLDDLSPSPPSLLPLMQQRLKPKVASPPKLTALSVTIGSLNATFHWMFAKGDPAVNDSRTADVTITYPDPSPSHERTSCFIQLLQGVSSVFTPFNLAILYIQFLPDYPAAESEWLALFAKTNNIIALAFDNGRRSTHSAWCNDLMLSLVRPRCHSTTLEDMMPPLVSLPRLQSIVLSSIDIASKRPGDEDGLGLGGSMYFLDRLCGVLAERTVVTGVPLSLNLKRCGNVNRVVVGRLRDVADVRWDQYEGPAVVSDDGVMEMESR